MYKLAAILAALVTLLLGASSVCAETIYEFGYDNYLLYSEASGGEKNQQYFAPKGSRFVFTKSTPSNGRREVEILHVERKPGVTKPDGTKWADKDTYWTDETRLGEANAYREARNEGFELIASPPRIRFSGSQSIAGPSAMLTYRFNYLSKRLEGTNWTWRPLLIGGATRDLEGKADWTMSVATAIGFEAKHISLPVISIGLDISSSLTYGWVGVGTAIALY